MRKPGLSSQQCRRGRAPAGLPAQPEGDGPLLGRDYLVRDYGLLEAAVARPQATVFGKDAYPDLDAKAAALLHSVARNHALIDGDNMPSSTATSGSL